MFETLRNNVDITALLIFLGFLLVVGTVGLWYVRKTTGRPMRDMLAVLGAAITLILLMVPAMVFFWDRVDSPDTRTRKGTEYIFASVFLPVAVVISWAFNRLARRRSSHKKRERDTTT